MSGVVVGVDGTVWATTEGNAPERNDEPRFESYARFDGRQFAAGGPDETLWLANTGFGSIGDVNHYDGGDTYHLTRYDGDEVVAAPLTPDDLVVDRACVTAHPDGSVWVATNAGLARIEPGA